MKKDFEFIKKILSTMEENPSPVFSSKSLADILVDDQDITINDSDFKKMFFHHLQLLADTNCITLTTYMDLKGDGIRQNCIGFIIRGHLSLTKLDEGIDYDNRDVFRITNNGHNLLQSLNDNKIMKKIKESGGKISIESMIGITTSAGLAALSKVLGL